MIGVTGHKFAMGIPAIPLVFLRGCYRMDVQFDSDERLQLLCHGKTEEPNPTIRVNQVPSPGRCEAFTNALNQIRQCEEVILKKAVLRDFPTFRWDSKQGLDSAFWRGIPPPVQDGAVECRFGNRARLDIADQVTIAADIPEIELLSRPIPLTADQDAISVSVRCRTRNNRTHDGSLKPADPLEEVGNLFSLPLDLTFVGEMLVLASSAFPKVGTLGFDSFRGGFQDSGQRASSKGPFDLCQLDLHLLAGAHPGNKYHEVPNSTHTFPTKCQIGDLQFDSVPWIRNRCRGAIGGYSDTGVRTGADVVLYFGLGGFSGHRDLF